MNLTANVKIIVIFIIVLLLIASIPWFDSAKNIEEKDISMLLESTCIKKTETINSVVSVIRGSGRKNLFQYLSHDNDEMTYVGCNNGELFIYTSIRGSHMKYHFVRNKGDITYQLLSKKRFME